MMYFKLKYFKLKCVKLMCFKFLAVLGLGIALFLGTHRLHGQSAQAQQLLLNVEKLAQFKQILSDMKKGYQVLNAGYTQVRNITEGNFRLHHVFLDGLWKVRPEIKQYWKVAAIIKQQRQLARAVPRILREWRKPGMLKAEELQALEKRLAAVLKESVGLLSDLAQILTGYALRMNDAERLEQIDRIFDAFRQQSAALRNLHTGISEILLQRDRRHAEIGNLKRLYPINPINVR